MSIVSASLIFTVHLQCRLLIEARVLLVVSMGVGDGLMLEGRVCFCLFFKLDF